MKFSLSQYDLRISKNCTIIFQEFIQKSSLNSHIKSHNTEKAYKCSLCGNEYKTPQAMDIHLAVHTSGVPYKCMWSMVYRDVSEKCSQED